MGRSGARSQGRALGFCQWVLQFLPSPRTSSSCQGTLHGVRGANTPSLLGCEVLVQFVSSPGSTSGPAKGCHPRWNE